MFTYLGLHTFRLVLAILPQTHFQSLVVVVYHNRMVVV